MIKLKNLLGDNKLICFEVYEKDYYAFLEYCRENGCHWDVGKKEKIDPAEDNYMCSWIMRVSNNLGLKYTNGWGAMITTYNCKRYRFSDVLTGNGCLSNETSGVLPQLSEKYNREYVIRTKTIDIDLLKRSAYCIAHIPNIAMEGRTRTSWVLNPFNKTGTDAARNNCETIDFSEFLRLFNDNK